MRAILLIPAMLQYQARRAEKLSGGPVHSPDPSSSGEHALAGDGA